MKVMIKCIFVTKSCILYFILFYFILFYFLHFRNFIFYSPKQGNSLNFPSMEYIINNLSARDKHFDVHLRRIRTVNFLSKDGKGASYDERDGWKSCLFPA